MAIFKLVIELNETDLRKGVTLEDKPSIFDFILGWRNVANAQTIYYKNRQGKRVYLKQRNKRK